MSEELLVGRGLTMRFGGVAAVDKVDISLAPGDHLGLIGPNGSGKTTLLNVISGVYLAHEGTLELRGQSIVRRGAGQRARSGIVRTFQHPQLAPSLTLMENVLLGERLGRRRHRRGSGPRARFGQRSRELLDMFGCADFQHELPGAAPYGAGKLAEVARAAAAAPSLLLLDEPAAGLSSEERGELVTALGAFRAAHPETAVCLVEHDVPLVSAVCDRLLVLNAGQPLSEGVPDVVLSDPRVRDAYLGPRHESPASVGRHEEQI
ncbi:MAG: ATP-binding cassette domain-containing protein [Nocardioides sp.]|uniref:ABC transporter ATP-binding protein n=1 Tax=Nocardioides sp. TaxID=35761 RepID=UPI0039E4A7C5